MVAVVLVGLLLGWLLAAAAVEVDAADGGVWVSGAEVVVGDGVCLMLLVLLVFGEGFSALGLQVKATLC